MVGFVAPPIDAHPLFATWAGRAAGDRGARLFTYPQPHDDDEARPAAHLLLVPGLIQNRFSFSLPRTCLVRALAGAGYVVHVLELFGRSVAGRRRTDGVLDYVHHDIVPALTDIVDGANGAPVGYVGHSMGGVLGTLLPGGLHRQLFALAALGSPLFVDVGVPLINGALRRARRVAAPVIRAGLPFDGRWLSRPFLRLGPLMDRPGARFFGQMWVPGSVDREDLAFFLAHSFAQDSGAVVDELLDANKRARLHLNPLSDTLPSLVLGGAADQLASVSGVIAFYNHIAGARTELEIVDEAPVGHIDMLVGHRAPTLVWPRLIRFLDAARDEGGGAV